MPSLSASASQSTLAGSELDAALRENRSLFAMAAIFSIVVNLLMLTGPIYMLQVYDRVLGSRSEPTLLALSVLALFLYLAMGVLDHVRARLLARIGMRVQARLEHRVFTAALGRATARPDDALAASAQHDLEAIQRYWTSPMSSALLDLPWTPLFLLLLFAFHHVLGWFALLGAGSLVFMAVVSQRLGKDPSLRANRAALSAEIMADRLKTHAEVLLALGMTRSVYVRWSEARTQAMRAMLQVSDLAGSFVSATRALRLLLQSAILGLGAWLVLKEELTSAVMIAASIVMGRAMAPIEQVVGLWPVLTRAREGRRQLVHLLAASPPKALRTELPRPHAKLRAEGISLMVDGRKNPVLRGISFQLDPGQALGIIGPSGAGKSTLGRVIIGAIQPTQGRIQLDGADLDHYDPDVLGSFLGYLPQTATLFAGTIAENIARLAPAPDPQEVVAAAKAANAHEMILNLAKGYDTQISGSGAPLSGGQIQRVGLARALYKNPLLLVLDEPNSNLDNEGSIALNAAIRQIKAAGGAAIVIAHRPAALQECDQLLFLEEGHRRAYGPRDDVLREMVKNHTELIPSKAARGGP
ncbi:type I secretion system permease/ATPase [Pseudorhodobacter sp. MZDSW-24AT]|uniref:type I secretion system permease/ATPase n=1 Tax=Pseudorhodobacter sp. MZDSW-24AT TaxID=2052957 RepID=UPI000C1EC7ED|nr:type I secretion system permease/ATPase [Pseudorhodobacter sp. MZDSW-24AT]PJF10158.1 type I secretion system permease/ATPase [Pseudorhodobacter sp. MZDSW-24AT]